MPHMHGSVTLSAATAATHASAALPPAFNIRKPASEARGCDVQIAPRVQMSGERREVQRGSDDRLDIFRRGDEEG